MKITLFVALVVVSAFRTFTLARVLQEFSENVFEEDFITFHCVLCYAVRHLIIRNGGKLYLFWNTFSLFNCYIRSLVIKLQGQQAFLGIL